MTKQDIENAIIEFKNILVCQAQLITFQKKLIYKIKENELKLFANSELKTIERDLDKKPIKNNDKKINKNKIGIKNNIRKITEKLNFINDDVKENIENKINSEYCHDYEIKFSRITYKELAEQIGVQISFIERLIVKNKIGAKLDYDSYIEKDNWIFIKDFVINKIKIINSAKRKENADKIPRIKNNKFSSSPLRQYVGGKFGKLIYIGKTY